MRPICFKIFSAHERQNGLPALNRFHAKLRALRWLSLRVLPWRKVVGESGVTAALSVILGRGAAFGHA